ncbi:MAG: sensor histidine kinase, partial [Limisphaerales bacterium]
MPDDFRPPHAPPPSPEFRLPARDDALFDTDEPHHFFYLILNRDGAEIGQSTNSGPEFTEAYVADYSHFLKSPPDRRLPEVSSQSQHIFLIRPLPSGQLLCVGCSQRPELAELRMTALWLALAGGIILVFGLAGGWFISSRAIRPVEKISATAVKIAGGDLSQRINIDETESELGWLAAVLNSTFARLESAFAQQKQFASDAAHELRTPVSVILTQTQMALAREREANDYKQTVEACQRAAQRMRKLIGALLDLARLDAGQEPMRRLPFDLSRMLAECVGLVRPLADRRGIRISVDISPTEVSGDAEKLAVVVTNLLTNAIEYNHEGGEVKIGVRPDGNMAVLTVGDTGCGISTN